MSVALGIIETNSVPLGIQGGDAMLKAAKVELVGAMPVCPGKYMVAVTGEVAAVKASVEAGRVATEHSLVDSLLIASVHEDLPAALTGCTGLVEKGAVGILETFSLCSAVLAADAAAKAADIRLIEVRLGRGLGGKSYVLLGGAVAAVREAVTAATAQESTAGLLGDCVVIPAPHPDMINTF